MSDPQTSQVGFYQPTRGSDAGTWDTPMNSNTNAMDSLAANVSIIPLTNANVTLSTPPISTTPWGGPYQSQSAILRFTGTLTANCTITLPRSGFWIVENLCTVGAYYVALASASPGKVICSPPGEAVHIYCDGTDVKYVDLGRIGEYLDLSVSTVPAWIANCTVPPYLNCNGATFSSITYPALYTYLGSTTLPDSRGRVRAALDQSTSRLNNIITSGIGNAGGDQYMQQHNHAYTGGWYDTGHAHGPAAGSFLLDTGSYGSQGTASGYGYTVAGTTASASASITNNFSISVNGSGAGQNVQPTFYGGLTMIRAG